MNKQDNGLRVFHEREYDRIVHSGVTLAVVKCDAQSIASQMPSDAAMERLKQFIPIYDRLYASKPAPSELMVNELTHIIRRDDGLLAMPTIKALWRRGVIKPAPYPAQSLGGRAYRDWEPVY